MNEVVLAVSRVVATPYRFSLGEKVIKEALLNAIYNNCTHAEWLIGEAVINVELSPVMASLQGTAEYAKLDNFDAEGSTKRALKEHIAGNTMPLFSVWVQQFGARMNEITSPLTKAKLAIANGEARMQECGILTPQLLAEILQAL